MVSILPRPPGSRRSALPVPPAPPPEASGPARVPPEGSGRARARRGGSGPAAALGRGASGAGGSHRARGRGQRGRGRGRGRAAVARPRPPAEGGSGPAVPPTRPPQADASPSRGRDRIGSSRFLRAPSRRAPAVTARPGPASLPRQGCLPPRPRRCGVPCQHGGC